MEKFFRVLAFLLLTIVSTQAQDALIWEISGNGLTHKAYLMATLKFIGEKEFFLPPYTVKLLQECKVFAIEDEVDHHAQHELNTSAHFPKGQSLSTVLSEAEYKKVRDFFQQEFKVNAKGFDKKYSKLKPLALSIIMTRLSLGERVKFYDIELLTMAKHHNLTAYSLEAVEREAEAFNKFSMDEQVKALLNSVDHFSDQKQQFLDLMTDYRKGNLQEIFAYTLHPTEDNPQFVEEFYFKRNEEWLPKIERMIKENSTFLAIGVSHLEGERGIMKLLERKGYTLTPVKAL